MAEQESKDKAEENTDIRKSREYRRFKKLLRKVIKAPPLRRDKVKGPESS